MDQYTWSECAIHSKDSKVGVKFTLELFAKIIFIFIFVYKYSNLVHYNERGPKFVHDRSVFMFQLDPIITKLNMSKNLKDSCDILEIYNIRQ
jgi:hypothetical protein